MEFKKPHLVHKKFTLPEGHPIKTIVMREIDGKDELEAARWASAKKSSVDQEWSAMLMEQVRCAIVAVDDKNAEMPFVDFDQWPVKTRRLVVAAWTQLNVVEEEDSKNFLESAESLNQ